MGLSSLLDEAKARERQWGHAGRGGPRSGLLLHLRETTAVCLGAGAAELVGRDVGRACDETTRSLLTAFLGRRATCRLLDQVVLAAACPWQAGPEPGAQA
jgi:hypothetical protein